MQDILKEIKAYCSIKNVGRKRVLFFLYWLYCIDYIKMKEIAYNLGIYHAASYTTTCSTILNHFIEYGMLKRTPTNINGNEVLVFTYKEPPTDKVLKYIKSEKNWIEIMNSKDEYEF